MAFFSRPCGPTSTANQHLLWRGMEKFCFYEIKPSIKDTKKNDEYENE
jgi:hypothetical protein